MRDKSRFAVDLIAELARVMASSASPIRALLDLALSCVALDAPASGAVAVRVDAATASWRVVASTDGVGAELGEAMCAEVADLLGAAPAMDEPGMLWDRPRGVQAGTNTVVSLCGSGRLIGALVLIGCPPKRWAAVPTSAAQGVTMCLAGGLVREAVRADAAFAQRSARAIRRLFVDGAPARGVEEAGAVVARVAAEAFETERAGMYVVDADGIICFAIGVGVSAELSDSLSRSLIGKVAADSPVWQALERAAGPSLIDDASGSDMRPGGFVQTMGFASYVAIPLLSKEGPLGMVICGQVSARRTWTASERELATQFALEGALVVDAARLRESERAQLAHITVQAYHDPLTGVPNRRMLMSRLEEALSADVDSHDGVALLLLDLDDFKQVNDTLGHRYGDDLLCEVAERLKASLRQGDLVARLGGDEFAILLSGSVSVGVARTVARKIDELLSVPVDLGGISVNAVASIGIALYPDHAGTATDLLQRADIAMYAAKQSGHGPTVYDRAQDDSTVAKLTLYTELRRGIGAGELRLAYQPKLDLRDNTITGVEALVRWQHPVRGLLQPGAFLPMAESTGLIDALTAWVVEQGLRQWEEWHGSGVTIDLALNVSVRNLRNQELLARITELINASRAADHLVLEVTETAVMVDPRESARVLSALHSCGVRISMDDFGTGYSSLTQLAQLPVDELKIDRLLVHDLETNPVNTAMVQTIVDLGHRLGLAVVAEGIETAQTFHAVRELGCDVGQGFFIYRPVWANEVVALVRRHRNFRQPAVRAS